jgi:hypothetical protein
MITEDPARCSVRILRDHEMQTLAQQTLAQQTLARQTLARRSRAGRAAFRQRGS